MVFLLRCGAAHVWPRSPRGRAARGFSTSPRDLFRAVSSNDPRTRCRRGPCRRRRRSRRPAGTGQRRCRCPVAGPLAHSPRPGRRAVTADLADPGAVRAMSASRTDASSRVVTSATVSGPCRCMRWMVVRYGSAAAQAEGVGPLRPWTTATPIPTATSTPRVRKTAPMPRSVKRCHADRTARPTRRLVALTPLRARVLQGSTSFMLGVWQSPGSVRWDSRDLPIGRGLATMGYSSIRSGAQRRAHLAP